MPVMLVEAPEGVAQDAKRKLMKDLDEALGEAYPVPDTRIWLREYPAENVAQDGRIGAEPIRPVCFLEAPELSSLDAKRKLVEKIHTAVGEAYQGIANTDETLILMNHYPLHDAGWIGRLQSDRPEVVAAIQQLNS
ncbi:tautomerase family protein [Pseudonocardia acaciae]|uniref:tautomerase family protein n=1 Tax=Pseudonocardia acaciae TaxID=551276 RepID=UPI00048CFE8E|nr:N-acetylmuramic acid 6-phosphate etherase [Pseudonocardia acaciae]